MSSARLRAYLAPVIRGACIICCASLSGCFSMNAAKLAQVEPAFDFIEYFDGNTRASGWFADRFGNVKRHFCGDFIGSKTEGVFVLDETLFYNDGTEEERIWNVSIDDIGNFRAESASLIGPATGKVIGNTLNLQYTMKVLVAPEKVWNLTMDDYMFLQADGSLHNITIVKKWGVRIGSVSTQYSKHDGGQNCSLMRTTAAHDDTRRTRILSDQALSNEKIQRIGYYPEKF